MKSIPALAIISLAICGASCSRQHSAHKPAKQKPVAAVVNYPLYFFARQIAGGKIELLKTYPPNCDPAFCRPDDNLIVQCRKADLILLNGADYAKWAKTAPLPPSKTVNTSKSFADAYLHNKHAVMHSHGPGGMHSHGKIDFNTWLDPEQAIKQSQTICTSVTKLMPQHKKEFQNNLHKLTDRLKKIDEDLKNCTNRLGDKPLLASHPVYNYLKRRYRWNLKSVHWEPNELTSAEEWQKLDNLLKTHPAKLMLWEDTPLPETAAKLKKRGILPVVFNPCANQPANRDYIGTMRDNIAALQQAIEKEYGKPADDNFGN